MRLPKPSPSARMVIVAVSLSLMAVFGRDLQQRVQTAQIVADAAADDRDTPSEATLQAEEIEGPALVGAYYLKGYVWAEAHGVTAAGQCQTSDRAIRDGCRADAAAMGVRPACRARPVLPHCPRADLCRAIQRRKAQKEMVPI